MTRLNKCHDGLRDIILNKNSNIFILGLITFFSNLAIENLNILKINNQ